MKPRVMLIEPSTPQSSALSAGLSSEEWSLEVYQDIERAQRVLDEQFQHNQQEFECVVFAWRSDERESLEGLLTQLNSPDLHDLKVLVMEVGRQPEARAWAAARAFSHCLPSGDLTGLRRQVAQMVGRRGVLLPSAVPSKAVPNAQVSILVVDDSPSIRHGLCALLNKQGYQVDAAASVAQARERASRCHYDIAVIDYYLGEDTGDELCRELSALPVDKRPACAILTGTYSDMIIQRALRAGAIECMFKNESHDLLLARIEAISLSVRQTKRLRAILEAMPHGVLCITPQGNVVYANRQLGRLARRRTDDFVKLSIHDLFDPLPHALSLLLQGHSMEAVTLEPAQLIPPREGQALAVQLSATALQQDQQLEGFVISVIPRSESHSAAPATPSSENSHAGLSWQQFVNSGAMTVDLLGSAEYQYALVAINPHCVIRNRPQAKPVPLTAMAHMREPLRKFLNHFAPPDRITRLAGGRYCLLLAYEREDDLINQTGRLVRMLPEIGLNWRFLDIATHTAVLPLRGADLQNADQLMGRVESALRQAEQRGTQRMYYQRGARRARLVSEGEDA